MKRSIKVAPTPSLPRCSNFSGAGGIAATTPAQSQGADRPRASPSCGWRTQPRGQKIHRVRQRRHRRGVRDAAHSRPAGFLRLDFTPGYEGEKKTSHVLDFAETLFNLQNIE